MTVDIRPLPAAGSTDWYGHYTDLDAAGRSSITVSDLANGTNAAAALLTAATDAVTRGVPLVLPAGKTIGVGSRVNLPTGLVLIANGATIKGASAFGDFLLTLGTNTTVVGHLRVETATGTNVRGVTVASGARIDALTITAVTPGSGAGDTNDIGLIIAGNDVRIGAVSVTNFDYPYKIAGANGVDIGRLDATNYVRGLYLTDSKNVTIHAGLIEFASPNATVSPGHNGILIDSTVHDATTGIRINNLTVRDAGEHGYRIGGNQRVKSVRFTDCAAVNVGGCGFKVLGGTATDGNYHEDIWVTNPSVEDAGQTAENAAGIQYEFVRRGKITNPIVRKRTKTYAAGFGVQLQACVEVDTINPTITDTLAAGYAVRGVLGDSTNVKLIGGSITVPAGDCVLLDYTGRTFRRVTIEGHPQLEVAGGTGACIAIVNTAGGAIVGGSWLSWQSVSAADRQTRGLLPGYHCDARAPFTGNPNFKPGSRWVEPWADASTGGLVRQRVPGAWATITPVQIVDAATHNTATEVDGVLYVGV